MSTLTTIASGDLVSTSRTDINNNFSALNTDKIETSVIDTDTALAANSDSKISSQKATKAYVDATILAGFSGPVQSLLGAGAVNLTNLTTKVTSTGANALTLADGTEGQIKIIVMVTDAGDATLTPTTKTGYTTIVFNDAGDGCGLVFTTTKGWIVFANFGCTIS